MTVFFKITAFANIGTILVRNDYGVDFWLSMLSLAGSLFLDIHTALLCFPTPYKVTKKNEAGEVDDSSWCWRRYKKETVQKLEYPYPQADFIMQQEEYFSTWGEKLRMTPWQSTHFENIGKYGRSTGMNMAIELSTDYPFLQITEIRERKIDPTDSATPERMIFVRNLRCFRRGQLILRESIAYLVFVTLLSTVPKIVLQVVTYHRLTLAKEATRVDLFSVLSGFATVFFAEVLGKLRPVYEVSKLYPSGDEALDGTETDTVTDHIRRQKTDKKIEQVGEDSLEARRRLQDFVKKYYMGTASCIAIVVLCMVQTQCDLGVSRICVS